MQISDPELRYFSKNVFYKSSRKLCDLGKVRIYNYDEDSVSGEVSDNGDWRINIWRNRYSNLQSDSDCRCYTNPCQHVVALLIAVLDEVNGRAPAPRVQQWEQYLQKLPELPPKVQSTNTPKSWKLIFFLRPGAVKWTLEARRTYVKKDGQLGQRGRLQLDYNGNLRDITASPAEEKAIACIRKINQNAQTYGYSSYYSRDNLKDLEIDYGQDVGYLLNALADCRLYLGPEEWKNNLQARRLSISAAGARLYFKLENLPAKQEQSQDYRLAPYIELNDTVLNFDSSVRILSATPLWLLVQDRLICIDTSFPARYLIPFTRKNTADLTIPDEDLGRFLQGFLPHINNRIELVFPENFRFEKVKELTGRRLYLHEKGENLCVTLKPVYGDIEIDGSAAGQISIASDDETNLLWQIERDSEAEAEIHDMLAVSGLEWDELLSCYVPAIDAVDWLFEALPKLAEAGFEIFGEENLKRKVNRATPSVNVVVSSGIDWLDMNIELDFNGIMLSLASLRQAVKKQSRYVKLADGSLAKIPDAWQKRFKHFFNFVTNQNGTVQVPSTQAMLIDALFEESEKKRYDDSFKKHLEKLKNFKGIEKMQVPENFQGTLRPYQREGLSWLAFLKDYGFNGCLADDMGLGKTVQTLALLLAEANTNGVATKPSYNGAAKTHGKKKTCHSERSEESLSEATNKHRKKKTNLIIAPLSVIFNWEKECGRFAPDLKVHTHHGIGRRRPDEYFSKYDIILTTYATMRRDVQFLKDLQFHYVILDESQSIKNPVALTAKAACLLNARHRLALTGTPVENNTTELWSQFSFLNPGMLGTLNYFRSSFAKPIEKYGDEESATLLKKMVSPFLLRRTKDKVLRELPERNEQVFYCSMSAPQEKFYRQVRDQYRAELMNLISTTGLQDARFKVLQGLTKLRQIACHPALVDGGANNTSGKFEAFLEQMQEILAGGHKVLVFSQFVRMLEIIRQALEQENIPFEMLTGKTRKREQCVQRFQEDESVRVFLISLKAGGLGLNLTAADYVMVYDPWWNPAAERQAIDRAHRIGQTKKVFAYKMITRNTVEEKILELQKRKENLVSQIITADSGLFKHLTVEDIRGLFS